MKCINVRRDASLRRGQRRRLSQLFTFLSVLLIVALSSSVESVSTVIGNDDRELVKDYEGDEVLDYKKLARSVCLIAKLDDIYIDGLTSTGGDNTSYPVCSNEEAEYLKKWEMPIKTREECAKESVPVGDDKICSELRWKEEYVYPYGSGTGFLIDGRYVMTAYHVVEELRTGEMGGGLVCIFDFDEVDTETENGSEIGDHSGEKVWKGPEDLQRELEVLPYHPDPVYHRVKNIAWWDKDRDLALLELDRCGSFDRPSLQLASYKDIGDLKEDLDDKELFTIAHPGGLPHTRSGCGKYLSEKPEGTITRNHEEKKISDLVYTFASTNDITSGASGAPVMIVDAAYEGVVVGVVTNTSDREYDYDYDRHCIIDYATEEGATYFEILVDIGILPQTHCCPTFTVSEGGVPPERNCSYKPYLWKIILNGVDIPESGVFVVKINNGKWISDAFTLQKKMDVSKTIVKTHHWCKPLNNPSATPPKPDAELWTIQGDWSWVIPESSIKLSTLQKSLANPGYNSCNFTVSRYWAPVNAPFVFRPRHGLLDSPPAEYDWDFGDGTGSSVQYPVHRYKRPGVFDVSLRITLAGGQIIEYSADDFVYVGESVSLSSDVGTIDVSEEIMVLPYSGSASPISGDVSSSGDIWILPETVLPNGSEINFTSE